ncbi:MAG: DUF2914 domain-containing protein [Candidatus Lernaella stagnicola]|nr:DUF2914 domain-containing protein [Candidatus Lernaella stagnicola]
MKKTIVLIGLALVSACVYAAAAQGLSVVDVTFCQRVVDREPIDTGTTFPADIGWLYCHTTISNPGEPAEIHHDWYYQDAFISRLTLTAGTSPKWRTFSAKQMSPAWLGKWEVVVKTDSGRELARKSFELTAPAE